jgi:hypothetical protein
MAALSTKNDSDFNRISEGVTISADTNTAKWHLNGTYLTGTVGPLRTRWRTKYAANSDPLTKNRLTAGEKDDARNDYEPVVSHLIEELRNNPDVTPDDLRAMDIYIPPHGNTPIPTTGELITFGVETDKKRRLVFHAHNESGLKGKPHGVGSIEFKHGFPEGDPQSVDELPETEFHSRTTFLIDFDEADRGKKVYFCGRWIMRTMAQGPWGDIHFAIIP